MKTRRARNQVLSCTVFEYAYLVTTREWKAKLAPATLVLVIMDKHEAPNVRMPTRST